MCETSTIKTCLSKQLEEIEMLSSIYCNDGEFKMEDQNSISQIQQFLNDDGLPPSGLRYVVSMQSFDAENHSNIDVCVELPPTYPLLEIPVITIRSASLGRHKDILLRHSMDQFITTLDKSDSYMFEVLCFIKDNIHKFIQTTNRLTASSEISNTITMERLWIYSHHIYNKAKRFKILQTAKDYSLSGFSRPGKPGIICVEGPQTQTQEFWRDIRSLQWQKITLKCAESKQLCAKNLDGGCTFKRFTDFVELYVMQSEDGEDCPMTMKNFVKYLNDHNSGYMVQELFGLIVK